MEDKEEESCVPWEVDYNIEYAFSIEGIVQACQNENPDSLCKQNACTVEMTFHHRVMNVSLSQPINAGLIHTNNQFNATKECHKRGGSVFGGDDQERVGPGGMDSCCREYAYDSKF